MALVNEHFLKLPGSYLFSDIAKKVNTFRITHPKQDIIRLGIGDVTRPLPPACIEAMHKAVEELAHAETFHGYGPTSLSKPLSRMTMQPGEFTFPTQKYSSVTEPKVIRETSGIFCAMTTA